MSGCVWCAMHVLVVDRHDRPRSIPIGCKPESAFNQELERISSSPSKTKSLDRFWPEGTAEMFTA